MTSSELLASNNSRWSEPEFAGASRYGVRSTVFLRSPSMLMIAVCTCPGVAMYWLRKSPHSTDLFSVQLSAGWKALMPLSGSL